MYDDRTNATLTDELGELYRNEMGPNTRPQTPARKQMRKEQQVWRLKTVFRHSITPHLLAKKQVDPFCCTQHEQIASAWLSKQGPGHPSPTRRRGMMPQVAEFRGISRPTQGNSVVFAVRVEAAPPGTPTPTFGTHNHHVVSAEPIKTLGS